MSTKKVFIPVVEFLEANKNKKVGTILEELKALVASKSATKTYIANEEGQTIAVYCYYHKQWEIVQDVPYGVKQTRPSGLNTMCKVGVSEWSKQQRVIKNINTEVLNKLETGEIGPEDITSVKLMREEEAKAINTDTMPVGYPTLEELHQHI